MKLSERIERDCRASMSGDASPPRALETKEGLLAEVRALEERLERAEAEWDGARLAADTYRAAWEPLDAIMVERGMEADSPSSEAQTWLRDSLADRDALLAALRQCGEVLVLLTRAAEMFSMQTCGQAPERAAEAGRAALANEQVKRAMEGR